MGLDQVQQYLSSRRVNEIQDFSNCALDEEGQALQAGLSEKYKVRDIWNVSLLCVCAN